MVVLYVYPCDRHNDQQLKEVVAAIHIGGDAGDAGHGERSGTT